MGEKSVYMSTRVPQKLYADAKRQAKLLDRPLSQIVREMLRAWLAEQSQPVQAVK
jgi:hypothetical protein